MKRIAGIFMSLLLIVPLCINVYAETNNNSNQMNMYSNSDFIEKEQPELNDETKRLISSYQKNPTQENYDNLRSMVIQNYDAVIDKKEAKLAELKEETQGKPGGEEKIAEMEEIVQEMYITYWSRINSSMLRFTDSRLLKWNIEDAPEYEYIPVMGAGESIYIGRTEVTNSQYKEYIMDTEAQAPSNWVNGSYPVGEDDLPVNFVSYNDAVSYCEWLTNKDGVNTYRLPTESEWELAAGHMPKDADFNCSINYERTSVYEYENNTRGAHGAIDFWGNVWEWTSTKRTDAGAGIYGVKGGSYESKRTDCRTEYRKEGRDINSGYEDVGFRVVQVLNGVEPEHPVDLITIGSAKNIKSVSTDNSITLIWDTVDRAINYQIFEYHSDTQLFEMIGLTDSTTFTIDNLVTGQTYGYIIQPVSYTAVADVVSPEMVTYVTCGRQSTGKNESGNNTSGNGGNNYNGLVCDGNFWWKVTYGEIDYSYSGLAYDENIGWWYVRNGMIDFTYDGLALNEYGWWKITGGTVDFTYNGLAYDERVGWWYVRNGMIDFTYDGLALNEYGWWKITGGTVDFTYSGLAYDERVGWWYVRNGAIDFTYDGLALNEYGWWKITEGTVDFNYTGTAENEYGIWNIVSGQLIF